MANMEDTALLKEHDRQRPKGKLQDGGSRNTSALTWPVFCQEVKKLCYIAGPMVAVGLSQYFLQVISLMMVGHLGELALSSATIASSLSAVTGFSLITGMSSALETLNGQAYGAKEYEKVGIQTQTAIFCLNLVSLPLSILWMFIGKILVFLGQDPAISHEAGIYMIWLVPALFAYATGLPIVRYFQMQSLTAPLLISSCATLCFHIPLCWVLVFKLGLENHGAALAVCVSSWLRVIILALYMNYSSACDQTRAPISVELFYGIREFFRFGIPSAIMVCLDWWAYELMILLSGLLPNPQLETSVLSICVTTIYALVPIPEGFAAAVSTRVSNELGAGNPDAAHIAVYAVLFVATVEIATVSCTLFASRHIFGYIFSNSKQVVDYFTTISPLVSLSVIVDCLQMVLSGVSIGCGWQHIGAYVNLAAFYIFGIPVAIILGFWFRFRGIGLWVGILVGEAVQAILFAIVTSCVNWEKQAHEARERLFLKEDLGLTTESCELEELNVRELNLLTKFDR